ncbi:hypothetical protein [Streptomyces sp. cmx-4-9]|uniref:hypothetical protein n=1 Tax=Streptomyces sp. cmx-4-9 TaxID=2790941 RepID=UPI0039814292
MSGEHARPTSTPFRTLLPDTPAEPAHAAGHARRESFGRRLRRRILAYRDIAFLSSRLPGDSGPAEECLLLVHGRKVVGQVHYRLCTECAEGVITGVDIETPLRSTGLGTRALSHLRARHPGLTWRSTLTGRTTRDLLRRMRIPADAAGAACPHTPAGPPSVPSPAAAAPVRPAVS